MSKSIQEIPFEELQEECQRLNIELMGTVDLVDEYGNLAPWYNAHIQRFNDWLAREAYGDMEWMVTQADKRCDPRLLLPEVKSGVALWIGHQFPLPASAQQEAKSQKSAKVARYAWGRDYHNVLRRVLRQLGKWMKQYDPELSFHGSVDTSPVLERAIAEQCGIGWIGKSTMLIHPKKGTFGSIAIALSSARFSTRSQLKQTNRCGTCSACLDACPTQALSAEGLDARKCISYWTIEHRGVIPESMRSAIGDWVFGCDICQDVCPWSQKAAKTQPPPSSELWLPQPERARPNLIKWLSMSDEALNQELQGSPLRRAFPHGLKRNAIIVLVNQQKTEALPGIIEQLNHQNLAVKVMALWAIRMLLSIEIQQEHEDKSKSESKSESKSIFKSELERRNMLDNLIPLLNHLKEHDKSTLILKELELTAKFLDTKFNLELTDR